LTNCLAVMETMWVCLSITLAVFIREVAVVIAAIICIAAGYNIQKHFFGKKGTNEEVGEGTSNERLYNTMDEEQPKYSTTTTEMVATVER
jgi:hypothetical protein